MFYGGQIFPEKTFFDLAHKGKIRPIKGVEVAALGPTSVQTTSGHSLSADLVIWATGYTKSYDWRVRLGFLGALLRGGVSSAPAASLRPRSSRRARARGCIARLHF